MMSRTKRISITVPSDLLEELKGQVRTRQRSRFISEAVREKLTAVTEQELVQGYREMAEDSRQLMAEFQVVDQENWGAEE